MQRGWSEAELHEHWSISPEEHIFLQHKPPETRLGCGILLKSFQLQGYYPKTRKDVPEVVILYLANQLGTSTNDLEMYSWSGGAGKRHRQQIRAFLGIRRTSRDDRQQFSCWLQNEAFHADHPVRALQAIAIDWFRDKRIEPPADAQLDRLIRSTLHQHENELFRQLSGRLSPQTKSEIANLLVATEVTDDETTDTPTEQFVLTHLKADPGRIGLKTLFKELSKLDRLRKLALPAQALQDLPPKWRQRMRQRTATESIWDMRRHPEATRHSLAAIFCFQREQEITDGLVELLIQIVHRISVRADRKVVKELLDDVQKVQGKTTLLFKLAEAALDHPEGVVKEVLYPVVSEVTLRNLIKEWRSQGPAYQQHVHTIVRRSYSHHYRRMLPKLLEALDFRSNNVLNRPVIQALQWLNTHRDSRQRFFLLSDGVPMEGVVQPGWRDIIVDTDNKGQARVDRLSYEICTLQALRERLRSKEIWVVGADRYRNPDDDLPRDFEIQRTAYYEALNQPLDADTFIAELQQTMIKSLSQLDSGMPRNRKVTLRQTGKRRIRLSPLEPQPDPINLAAFKAESARRWPMTSLLDILKETDLRIGFTEAFQRVAGRTILDPETLQRRLLLCLYGLGTNAGLKRMISGSPDISYDDLRYIKRHFIQKASLREAIANVVNATFAARLPEIWGEGTTACASDGKKFGAWDQNLMTEWHIRYGGRGVMIYWHVEERSACIYSQLKRCSSSEVASMIEGVLRHCTTMEIEKQYVDSHGQSEVGFAFCHLLGFDLLPRLKALAVQRLSRPTVGNPESFPNLQPILTKPINWALIRQQYDEMIKFATALRLGTAEPEAILRRFTRNNIQHPTYQALTELGKAIKTAFLCRYLDSEALRQEINAGLNVVENWNSVNSFIFYGKSGEIATNRLDDQELAVLSLHLLQICLVYINTLMIQRVLAEPAWMERMTPEDFRALTPLIYNHVTPYGTFDLDLAKRLPLDTMAAVRV